MLRPISVIRIAAEYAEVFLLESMPLKSLVLSVSLGPEIAVESLLSTLLCTLNVTILGLKASVLSLQSHRLGNEGLLAVFLGNTTTEELGRPLYNRANLRELGYLRLSIFLFVVPFGVQYRAHPQDLQISF